MDKIRRLWQLGKSMGIGSAGIVQGSTQRAVLKDVDRDVDWRIIPLDIENQETSLLVV
jgi:hypothetical protein